MMKLKSQAAILREYRRAQKAIGMLNDATDDRTRGEIYGAQQALAWALNDYAMAPVECALPGLLRRQPKRKNAKR